MVPAPPHFKPGIPDAEPGAGGTWLPTPLDEATADLIGYCREAYPDVVAVALDAARAVELARSNGLLEIQRRALEGELLLEQTDRGWPTWAVTAFTLGVGMVTLGVGLAAGYFLGRVAP